ncbi:MAG: hypothetical protein CME62_15125 [Halobacteriovoraceae bacterium]|nr:hypothetical protein [Halobacteriovoraceae bacterium]
MKNKLVILTMMMAMTSALAAERKISSIYFYSCTLERQSELKYEFNKRFVFPLQEDMEEDIEMRKSMRWHTSKIKLSPSGNLHLKIEEFQMGQKKVLEKNFKLEGFSYQNPVQLTQDNLVISFGEKKVRFNLRCE